MSDKLLFTYMLTQMVLVLMMVITLVYFISIQELYYHLTSIQNTKNKHFNKRVKTLLRFLRVSSNNIGTIHIVMTS